MERSELRVGDLVEVEIRQWVGTLTAYIEALDDELIDGKPIRINPQARCTYTRVSPRQIVGVIEPAPLPIAAGQMELAA